VAHAQARVERARAVAQARYERTLAGPQRRLAVPPDEHCRVRRAKEQLRRAQEAQSQRAAVPPIEETVNLTDPQSRVMKSVHGWLQGYNCQLAVTEDHVVLAVGVTQNASDARQFQPMMAAAVKAAAELPARSSSPVEIETVIADAGYFSAENVTAPGPDRLIATSTRRKLLEPESAPDARCSEVRQRMHKRLTSPEGQALYRRRGAIVEPVNGHLKDRRGLRMFRRRGLTAVTAELNLAGAVHNLLRLANRTAIA
jgi:hypothetical protein